MIIMGSGKYAPKYEWKEVILKTWPYNLAHAIAYGDGQEVSDEEASQMYNLYIPYLFNMLTTLSELQKKVIFYRFKDGLTLEQTAAEFNTTRYRIADIEERAFIKLRNKYKRGVKIFIGMPNITPHVCRHTYCSNQAKAGMNPKTLQYLMGHSDIDVTMNVYTHLGMEDAAAEMARMEEVESARREQEKLNGVKEGKEKQSRKMFRVV